MSKRKRGRPLNGILLLDKPQGDSSNRCLQHVKRLLDAAKAGHTGSLDPLATGVLPLCFGEATKISQFLLDSDKTYCTTIKLGVRTDSGDSQGEVIDTAETVSVSEQQLEAALEQFRGVISQVPSMFSALKKDGVPLYKLARQGKTVEREAREVTIHSLKLLAFTGDEVELEVHCTKGTYIRSIADDLGQVLGCGAHVTVLRRIKAGPFTIDNCLTFEELEANLVDGRVSEPEKFLLDADLAVSELPAVELSSATGHFVRQGQAVLVSHLPTSGLVRLYEENEFIGIGIILDDGRVAPRRLFVK